VPNACKSDGSAFGRRPWRTGEEHVANLPTTGGYPPETATKTAYAWLGGPRQGKAFGLVVEGAAAD
jgi:hypothetical protein